MINKQLRVYFYRDYRRFQGGHLKVFDYFNHLSSSEKYRPMIYFTPESRWEADNPWVHLKSDILPRWEPHRADILFIAGMDWQAVPNAQHNFYPVPIINLIQGIRHADPALKLHQFLSNRAIRICVSPEVSSAILGTGKVNGPVFTIPNGLDCSGFPHAKPHATRSINLLIIGMKRPGLSFHLHELLKKQGIEATLMTTQMPRPQFLKNLAEARVAVFLPHDQEGFYLPALEGMALGCFVICPDCGGNRSFCLDGINCLRPPYHIESLERSIKKALYIDEVRKQKLLDGAKITSEMHSLYAERSSFLELMKEAEKLYWKGT